MFSFKIFNWYYFLVIISYYWQWVYEIYLKNFCGILYFYKFLWTYQNLIEKEKGNKKLLASILCLCLIFTSTAVAVSTSVSADDYTLVWSDEFDGAGVNPWNWTLDQGVRNGERQTYTLDNVSVQTGLLAVRSTSWKWCA